MSQRFSTVSVLIPCYNEVATIDRTLDAVLAIRDRLSPMGLATQIVAVDDASGDQTYDRLTLRARDLDGAMVVARHPVNSGKGSGLRVLLTNRSFDVLTPSKPFRRSAM